MTDGEQEFYDWAFGGQPSERELRACAFALCDLMALGSLWHHRARWTRRIPIGWDGLMIVDPECGR